MMFFISFLIGLTAAFVGSLIGLGGGIILVPVLLLLANTTEMFSWATPQVTVGVSLVTMVFTGLASTRAYLKLRRVDIRTGFLLVTGGIPGSMFGAWLNLYINPDQFSLYLGLLMIFILGLLSLDREKLSAKRRFKETKRTRTFTVHGEVFKYNVHPAPAFVLSFIVGSLSALFGISGGAIAVPTMILLFGIPVQVAIGTSMFMVLFISFISAVTHSVLGNVMWEYVLFFIIGAYLGGTIGARTGQYLKGNVLEWILRIVVLTAAIRLILEGVG